MTEAEVMSVLGEALWRKSEHLDPLLESPDEWEDLDETTKSFWKMCAESLLAKKDVVLRFYELQKAKGWRG